MVTEEWKAKQMDHLLGPDREASVSELRKVSQYTEAVRTRRSATIEKMQLARMRPRLAKERDLVPVHVRERYAELWQAEDRRLLAEARWEASLRGRLRMWVKKAVGI